MKNLTILMTAGFLFGNLGFAATAKAQATVATLTVVTTYSDEEVAKADEESDAKKPDEEKAAAEAKVKLNGRVILIGPDGKKKEFDINDPKAGTLLLQIDDDKDTVDAMDEDTDKADSEKDAEASQDIQLEERFVIGVQCEDASEVLRSHLELGDKGIVINEVREETPADDAGLQKFDIVLKINDKELGCRDDLITSVLESEGKTLTLAIIRAGKRLSLEVTPTKMKVPVAVGSATMDLSALHGLTGAGQQVRLRLSHPGVLIQEGMPQDQEEINKLVERIRSTAGDEAAKSMMEARDAMMLRATERQHKAEEQTKALNETLKALQDQMKGLQDQMKSLQEKLPEGK